MGASVVTVEVGLDAAVSVDVESVDAVDAEAVGVGASVVTVEVGLDAAVSVDVEAVDAVDAEAVEVGASGVTVEVGLDAAVSVVARELFNPSECLPSECFHSIPLSEFIDFMCFSS
ncbi:hypothetical protein [Mesorhizobium onobrychidis]|uniref:Uncharacterized protein n=1 Tax=Mesorhizobium onobrychidis TaxID=2775404 RepID=A0ABY5QQA0_9HYPH|nr:hypothetical protein [Mesorhizobium onobrychidis]UVC12877.1 hypothetical protein IHQ72_19080 [Mesorhizobium onobrychidis]